MTKLPVEVTGITGCAPYQGYLVILKEMDGKRWLPILVGAPEAHNISLLLQGLRYVRPLTYDLFGVLLEAASAKVNHVTVTDLRDNTFYAEVTLAVASGDPKTVDARPSDAIALAIKTRAPIFVNARVMDEAGLIGEMGSPTHDSPERLRDLNKQLRKAVESEAYEEAARLRDEIRSLEEQTHSS
jgi:hypothetical protein